MHTLKNGDETIFTQKLLVNQLQKMKKNIEFNMTLWSKKTEIDWNPYFRIRNVSVTYVTLVPWATPRAYGYK